MSERILAFYIFFVILIRIFRSGGTGGSAASSPALLRDSPQYKPAVSATSLLLAASTTPPSVSYRPRLTIVTRR